MKSVHSGAYKAVVQALKQARLRAGLTQQQVAKRLGRPQSFVAEYESGERRVDAAEFIAIARAMGVEPGRVFSAIVRKAP